MNLDQVERLTDNRIRLYTTHEHRVEHITKPRRTWKEAGHTLSVPPPTEEEVRAGITEDEDGTFGFLFRSGNRWISRKGFRTRALALENYNDLIEQGVIPSPLVK